MEDNTISNTIAYVLWIVACATLSYIAIMSWGTPIAGIPVAFFTIAPMAIDARRYLNRDSVFV